MRPDDARLLDVAASLVGLADEGAMERSARIPAAQREHSAWRGLGVLEEQLLAAEQAGDDAGAREIAAKILAARGRIDDLRRSDP